MFHVHILHTLDLFGTVVFAASGALIAHKQRQNGCCAVVYAGLTALGGGTIRDILLTHQPVFWVRSPTYLWTAISVGLLIFTLAQFIPIRRDRLRFADAVSLAVFSIVGTQVAMASPSLSSDVFFYWATPPLMGLLTGVGGGLVRDVIDRKTPFVMQNPYYALAALVCGSVYDILVTVQVPILWAAGSALAIVFLFLLVPAQGIFESQRLR